ncbi:MAG: arginine deiminase-related protein [Flavobacteriales bacterium]|nr:arginine deiminase-related protein [Flavobacteriales bacterium]
MQEVLLVTPDWFEVVDVKNIHMKDHIGNTNLAKARKQWEVLKTVYEKLQQNGIISKIHILNGTPQCEDMVFAANQSLPFVSAQGKKSVVLSRMKHATRQREIPAFREFYKNQGFEIIEPPENIILEGMGDILPVPFTDHWIAGYGHRTTPTAIDWLRLILPGSITAVELVSEYFYHLDTCLIPVNAKTALYQPLAFSTDGIKILQKTFRNLIEVPIQEAKAGFALNAHLVQNSKGQKAAIIQQGNTYTERVLAELGFEIFSIDTSEFIKSGGSVFCMKMMLP